MPLTENQKAGLSAAVEIQRINDAVDKLEAAREAVNQLAPWVREDTNTLYPRRALDAMTMAQGVLSQRASDISRRLEELKGGV